MNTLKTTFLMALLTVLLVVAGGALGGQGGMVTAFLFALVMNGVSYWFSDKIVLRMYSAREALFRWYRAPQAVPTVTNRFVRRASSTPVIRCRS